MTRTGRSRLTRRARSPRWCPSCRITSAASRRPSPRRSARRSWSRPPRRTRRGCHDTLQATGWLASPIMTEIAARWISSGTTTTIVADRRREAEARQTLLRETLGLSRSVGLSARAPSLAGASAPVGARVGLRRYASPARRAGHERRCVRRRRDAAGAGGSREPRGGAKSPGARERARDRRVAVTRRSRARPSGEVDVAATPRRTQ